MTSFGKATRLFHNTHCCSAGTLQNDYSHHMGKKKRYSHSASQKLHQDARVKQQCSLFFAAVTSGQPVVPTVRYTGNPPIVPKIKSQFLFEVAVRVSVRRLVYDQKDGPLRYKTPADSAPWTGLRKYRTIVRMARPPDYL